MFRIIAPLEAYGSIIVKGKHTGLSITTKDGTKYVANTAGRVNVDIPKRDEVEYIFREFPFSQYGAPYETTSLGVTSTAWSIVFSLDVPAFIGGALYTLKSTSINLATIKSNPANTTFYAYCSLKMGSPEYTISTTEIAETETRMFIGTIVTGASNITSNTIQRVSRFGLSRPSTVKRGSSFPVSTGLPNQSGTINW